MIEYQVIWDGTPAYYGGYLSCEPETARPEREIDAPERIEPLRRRIGYQPPKYAGMQASLIRTLEARLGPDPLTIAQIMIACRWRYNTTANAVYWFRRAHPGVLKVVLVARVGGKGRRPLGYYLSSPLDTAATP